VIGNDNAGGRIIAAQNHVTASLTTKFKTGAFENAANFAS
jgi:hypothetical protein